MDKVLIISYSFPPSNAPAAQRPYFLAKYLKEYGLYPVVLTPKVGISSMGSSNALQSKSFEGEILTTSGNSTLLAKGMSTEETGGNSILKKLVSRIKAFLKSYIVPYFMIPDRGIIWKKEALKEARLYLKANSDVKYIYSTSPFVTNHIIAKELKKEFELKWIADIRDYYYVENLEHSSRVLRKYFDRNLEKDIVSDADHITFVSPSMRKDYCNKYDILAKSSLVYNGFDPKEHDLEIIDFKDDLLRIFYAGSFYGGLRSPFPLIESLSELITSGQIDPNKIEILIAGSIESDIVQKMEKYPVFSCIRFLGKIPRHEVLKYYKSVDFLWLIVSHLPHHSKTIPLKLFEYIGSRKPILCYSLADSESAIIVEKFGLGNVFDTKSKENHNTKKLIEVLNSEKDFDAEINEGLFSREKQTKIFAELFKSL